MCSYEIPPIESWYWLATKYSSLAAEARSGNDFLVPGNFSLKVGTPSSIYLQINHCSFIFWFWRELKFDILHDLGCGTPLFNCFLSTCATFDAKTFLKKIIQFFLNFLSGMFFHWQSWPVGWKWNVCFSFSRWKVETGAQRLRNIFYHHHCHCLCHPLPHHWRHLHTRNNYVLFAHCAGKKYPLPWSS